MPYAIGYEIWNDRKYSKACDLEKEKTRYGFSKTSSNRKGRGK